MPKHGSSRTVEHELLTVLTENLISTVTSRDVQTFLPGLIQRRFGHQIMPETVARAWRALRAPESGLQADRILQCHVEEVRYNTRRTMLRWTITDVREKDDTWSPWGQYLKESCEYEHAVPCGHD